MTDTPPVRISTVCSRAARRAFLDLPKRIYRDDPHWIAPLRFEERQRVFGHNPLFAHAEVRAWLAMRGDLVVGRITAQVDALQQRTLGEALGMFGMLEAEDDGEVFAALSAAAEHWLRDRGCTRVQGPFSLSINEEVGLLTEGFAAPPFVMMGHGRRYYPPSLEALGYRAAQELLTYTIRPDFVAPAVMTRLAERVAGQVRIRPLRRKNLDDDLEILRDLFNDAWANNWGFVPFTEAEFRALGRTLAALIPDEYVQIAELDGQPAAFIVALPNVNEAARDLGGRLLPWGWAKLLWRLKVRGVHSARVPLMGVRRGYQQSRLGPTLAFLVIDAVRQGLSRRGVDSVEMGWILEGNSGMRNIIEAIGGAVYKRYRIYQKEL